MSNDDNTPGYGEQPPEGPQPGEQPTDWFTPTEEPTASYPPAPPPSVTIPAETPPPAIPPVGPVAPAAAPAPPPEEDQPTRMSELGWKVATAVAVLLASGALIWGFMQKNNAEELAADQGAALVNAQEQIDADLAEEEELQERLDRAKAAHDRVEEKLKTKKRDLQEEARQLEQLRDDLRKARRTAASEEATLRDELDAAEREADLATKCAQVLATGMRLIYDAPTPEEGMNEVVREIDIAAQSCNGVVNVG